MAILQPRHGRIFIIQSAPNTTNHIISAELGEPLHLHPIEQIIGATAEALQPICTFD
jgi:hypothetical protein